MPTPADSPPQRPWTLAALVAIILAEALVLLGFAVYYAVGILGGEARVSPGGALFTLVLLAVFGVWLASVGAFLWRGRRWTRAAALVAQLFALVIGVPTLSSGFVLYGALILVPAIAACFLLFERRVLLFTQPASGGPRS